MVLFSSLINQLYTGAAASVVVGAAVKNSAAEEPSQQPDNDNEHN